MSETVLQEGTLGDLPLVDLVLSAHGSRWPTTLELSRGGTTRSFGFRDGALVEFATTNPKEGLAEFLVRRKKLEPGAIAQVQAYATEEGVSAASSILRQGLLPMKELIGEMSAWASLLLVQAFSWDVGSYRVYADADAVAPEAPLEVAVPAMVAQAVWKRMDLPAIRGYVAPYLDERAQAAEHLPFPITDFRLPPDRLRFWEELRQAPTVRTALADSSLPEDDAWRTLFLLQRTGMLEMIPVAPAEPETPDVEAWLKGMADFGDDDAFGDEDLGDEDLADEQGSGDDDLGDDLGDLLEEDQVRTNPSMDRFEERPAVAPPRTSPPRSATAHSGPDLGVDLSSIGFRGGAGGRTSNTTHVSGGARETLTTGSRIPAIPKSTPKAPPSPGLAGLFSDMALPTEPSSTPRRGVAPPRAGRSGWKPGNAGPAAPRAVAPPRGAAPVQEPAAPSDGPPRGPGPIIEAGEWADLPTKEKDRVRGLRQMLIDLSHQNYYEYFELSEEATEGLIKKAYFKLARRFHPDALVDEGPIYARLAEAVFAEVSQAYEVLSDEEQREKYTSKHIRGEKDENELAMEKVQKILGAESAFKAGIRLINQGKAPAAVEKLTEAVELYDEEPEYRGWLGYALFRANQRADYQLALKGEEMVMQAIADRPMVADLPHLMGKIAMQRKDWSSARGWLRKSLKLKPDNPEALREYKRVDEMIKGGGAAAAAVEEKSGLKGLFGRFGGKK